MKKRSKQKLKLSSKKTAIITLMIQKTRDKIVAEKNAQVAPHNDSTSYSTIKRFDSTTRQAGIRRFNHSTR